MILIFACVGVAFASACGENEADDDRIHVIATTTIAADIVRNVAGPEVEVETLIPESASPHDFALSAQDRAELEDADVVVAWGAGLEEGLPLDELDKEPVELAAGEEDPHIWMDPRKIALSLAKVSTALADVDPGHTSAYRERAAAYVDALAELDRDVRHTLEAVPASKRKLVTSHDSLGHFVSRFDFDFVGAPFGLVPESEASAETVASLIDRVKSEDVPAVFAEDTDDPGLMRQIADEAGVEVVDDLLTEGFGERVDSYEEMLRYDADRIAEALAP